MTGVDLPRITHFPISNSIEESFCNFYSERERYYKSIEGPLPFGSPSEFPTIASAATSTARLPVSLPPIRVAKTTFGKGLNPLFKLPPPVKSIIGLPTPSPSPSLTHLKSSIGLPPQKIRPPGYLRPDNNNPFYGKLNPNTSNAKKYAEIARKKIDRKKTIAVTAGGKKITKRYRLKQNRKTRRKSISRKDIEKQIK